MSRGAEATASWDDLARECDAWAAAGGRVELWWRDDDAIADTPELRRLLDLAGGRAPLALAVIPAGLRPDLARLLAKAAPGCAVLQHGFDHRNRSAAGAKKSEFPAERPGADVAQALAQGRDLLAVAFGRRFVPALTPPWNRFDPGHLAALPALGFRGLTTYLARRRAEVVPGLRQVNTHVDVVDWHGAGGRKSFIGTGRALGLLAGHLAAKRLRQADALEPTGVLTHHLVHDTETWDFLAELLDWCGRRTCVHWCPAADLFPEFGA